MFGISEEAQIRAERAIVSGDYEALASIVPPTAVDLQYSGLYLEVG